ncbi:MAG: hypothetical protein AAF986_03520 [Pseudomonadota bacterium]
MADEKTPTESENTETTSNKDTPDTTSEAIDAEIVEDVEEVKDAAESIAESTADSTDANSETVASLNENGDTIIEDPEQDEVDDSAVPTDEAANDDEKPSKTAAPFAMIIGAVAVVGGLTYFLNRDDIDTPSTEEVAATDAEAPALFEAESKLQIAQPISSSTPEKRSTPQDNIEENGKTADEVVIADVEDSSPKEADTTSETLEIAENDTEATDAPEESAAEVVDAVLGTDVADAADEQTEVSELLEEAAAQNQARREAEILNDTTTETGGSQAANIIAAAIAPTEEDAEEDKVEAIAEEANDVLAAVEEANEALAATEAEVISASPAEEDIPSENDTDMVEFAPTDTEAPSDEMAHTGAVDAMDVATNETSAANEELSELPADPMADESQTADTLSDEEGTRPAPATIAAQLDDIKSDVKATVLAETTEKLNETEQKISLKIEETGREVKAIREELTEQQQESDQRLAELSTRLETIQSSDISQAKRSTLLLALSDLSEGVQSGKPFLRQLDTIAKIAPGDRTLVALHRYADEGLPTTSDLRFGYQSAARMALSNTKRENAEGPMGRLMANLSGLFIVRKVGEVPGDSPSAIIARAESRLENNDLQAAVHELKALNGSAKIAFDEWIKDAEAKVDAQQRIDTFEKAITSSVG